MFSFLIDICFVAVGNLYKTESGEGTKPKKSTTTSTTPNPHKENIMDFKNWFRAYNQAEKDMKDHIFALRGLDVPAPRFEEDHHRTDDEVIVEDADDEAMHSVQTTMGDRPPQPPSPLATAVIVLPEPFPLPTTPTTSSDYSLFPLVLVEQPQAQEVA